MRARHLAGSLVFVAALAWLAAAHAQEQPIRIIFPFAAGGSGDALSRLVADKMRVALGRPVVVENRTGAAGRLGVMAVKTAAPDGNTLLITPIAPMAVYPHVYKNLDYDPLNDFVAVSQLATFDLAVAVGSHVPVGSLGELVIWVKGNPAHAAFGSPAAGALPHFFGVLFSRAAELDLRHIAYRGSAAALADLVAGHIPMVFTTVSDLVAMHRANRVRILATSGKGRSPFVPDVPTFREAGYDIQGTSWFGAFAPVETPPDTIERYAKIMADVVQLPEVKERLRTLGLEPTGTTAAEFAAIQRADSEIWAPAVKASGFTPQP